MSQDLCYGFIVALDRIGLIEFTMRTGGSESILRLGFPCGLIFQGKGGFSMERYNYIVGPKRLEECISERQVKAEVA